MQLLLRYISKTCCALRYCVVNDYLLNNVTEFGDYLKEMGIASQINTDSNLYAKAINSFVDWESIRAQVLPSSLLAAAVSVGLIYAYPLGKYFKAKKQLNESIKKNGDVKNLIEFAFEK